MAWSTNNERSRLLQDLLDRIHREHHKDEQAERGRHFRQTLLVLLLCALGIFAMQFHIQIYNVIVGPFHLNREQLANYLQIYNRDLPSFRFRAISTHKGYFQIEIGEDVLQLNRPNVLHVFDEKYTRRRTVATIHIVKEATIADGLSPDRFFIKLASETQSHSRVRLPYHFQAFTIRTLRCAVRQLGVRPSDYNTSVEKSMYVQTIEKHYVEDATYFNTKVAPACGMLMGYLYRPNGERAYLLWSTSVYKFHQLDVGFDASRKDYPYAAFVFVGVVFAWLVLKSLVHLTIYLFHWLRPLRLVLSPAVQAQLDKLDVYSLQSLDDFLCAPSDERHFHHRLFLLPERYLLVVHVRWYEHNPERLSEFYTESPFTVYAVASITKVLNGGFFIEDSWGEKWISFPSATSDMDDSAAPWLHRQMMSLSERYRQNREQEEQLARLKELRTPRELDATRRRALLREEEHRQQVNFGGNFERMLAGVASASPRFIADFRFETHPTVQAEHADLLTSKCSVCLDDFEIGQTFVRWPCPGQHPFHYACMLDTLRRTNTCPLCRSAVEPAPMLDRGMLYQRMIGQSLFRFAV